MLDIKQLRRDPEGVSTALARRGMNNASGSVAALLARDRTRRDALREGNDLKSLRNRVSRRIGELRREGGDASGDIARMREVGARIGELDAVVAEADAWISDALAAIPNIPDARVPEGGGGVQPDRADLGVSRPNSPSRRGRIGNWAPLCAFWILPAAAGSRVRASTSCAGGERPCSAG